ncbi:serine hydrolase [Pseudomonas lini]
MESHSIMPKKRIREKLASYSAFALLLGVSHSFADERIEAIVKATIEPVMQQQQIPGVAVAITVNGKAHYFNYGVASKENGKAVTEKHPVRDRFGE